MLFFNLKQKFYHNRFVKFFNLFVCKQRVPRISLAVHETVHLFQDGWGRCYYFFTPSWRKRRNPICLKFSIKICRGSFSLILTLLTEAASILLEILSRLMQLNSQFISKTYAHHIIFGPVPLNKGEVSGIYHSISPLDMVNIPLCHYLLPLFTSFPR